MLARAVQCFPFRPSQSQIGGCNYRITPKAEDTSIIRQNAASFSSMPTACCNAGCCSKQQPLHNETVAQCNCCSSKHSLLKATAARCNCCSMKLLHNVTAALQSIHCSKLLPMDATAAQ